VTPADNTAEASAAFVGIDLGTTSSCIAVWQNGKARCVPESESLFAGPSTVYVDAPEKLLLGKQAQTKARNKSSRSIKDVKNIIGLT